eukprot:m.479162 g.479162  ORF g.479162 m.479162 type:complete len:596 (+) comp21349_c0_seq1:547-2334(+)
MAARLVPPSRLANLGLAHCRGASIRVASEDDKKKRHRPLFARLASQQVTAEPMYLANSFDGAAAGMQAQVQPQAQQLLPSLQASVVANDTSNTAALTAGPVTPALEPPAVSATATAATTSVNPSHLEHRLDSLALPPLALQDLFNSPRYALTSTATSAMAAPATSGMLATVRTPVAYALPAELTQQQTPSNTINGGANAALLPSLDAPVSHNNYSNFGFEDLRLLLDESMFADPTAAVPCDVLSAPPPTGVVTPGTSSSDGDAAMLAAAFDGTLDGLIGSSLDVPSMAMPAAAPAASPDSNANDPMASLLDAVVADTGAGPMDISADVLSETSIDDFADESLDVRSLRRQQHSPRNLSDGSSSEGDDAGNLVFSVGVAAAMTDVQAPHGARRTRSGRLSQQRRRAGELPAGPVEAPVAASSRVPSALAPKRASSNSSAKTRRRKNVRSLQTPVRSSAPRKRRTQRSRKEPERVMFATDEEFDAAWQRWRQSRDSNNESVHRSRELLRKQRAETAQLKAKRERDNRRLEAEAASLQQTLSLLVKATQDPHSLQPDEVQRLRETMKQQAPAVAQPEPQANVPPNHTASANRLCNTAL